MSYEAEWIVALITRRAAMAPSKWCERRAVDANLRRWVRRLFDNA